MLRTTGNAYRITDTSPITVNTTFNIGAGLAWTEPGTFMEWLNRRRIMPGVTVTVDIADGTYTCTKTIRGHIDGARIVWENNGVNGSPLTGASFAALDSIWVIDPVTGQDPTARATAKAAAEVIVRASFKVILEWASADAMSCDGFHLGDWSDCPCLFINTGTSSVGLTTGTRRGNASNDGAAGCAIVDGSFFFGFDDVCINPRYGGMIEAEGSGALFADNDCCRSDFAGGFRTSTDIVIIGAGRCGFWGHHGGYLYAEAAYIRGCEFGVRLHDATAMFWLSLGADIQFNTRGIATIVGGTGLCFDSTIKNNAFAQIHMQYGGSIDASAIDMASTEQFDGAPPAYGVLITGAGSIDLSNGIGASTITGHDKDIHLSGTALAYVGIDANEATYGGAWSSNEELIPDDFGNIRVPPTGRPTDVDVEMSGTELVLPNPCPITVNVVQPAGSAGTPITIDTIDVTYLPRGQEVLLRSKNANEPVTVNDSSDVSLAAAQRYLSNARDCLVLFRPSVTDLLMETSFKKNQSNGEGATKRVRVFTVAGSATMDRDDDVLVVNKATGAATAVALDSGLNFTGSEIIVKDGKGDAGSNNITITPGDSKTVDGGGTYVISTNYGRVRLIYNGTEWNVLNA